MNDGLRAARAALAGAQAWLVGGLVRDRALGRDTADVDIVIEGDPARAARAVARAAGGAACFALSEQFGAWRVAARGGSWQVDIEPLRARSLAEDLALRDFTINAVAEPLAGGAAIDPLGGLSDLEAHRLRAVGDGSFAADPVRVLRLARLAVELSLRPDEETLALARASASGLSGAAGERVFAELRRVIASPRAVEGVELMERVHALGVVLPELAALRGVEQSRYHHSDVYGHTLEVLEQAIDLPGALARTERAAGPLGEDQVVVLQKLLDEPLADELTRAQALRWGALLHDAAKPHTRRVREVDARVTFIGHDQLGAELARGVLERLRTSERLRAHTAALVRHHLRLGFLVHEPQPLARRTVFAYLRACSPVALDVTLLSIADRLATRGEGSDRAIEAHLRVARAMLGDALRWHAHGPPAPLLRGDELAGELCIATGPRIGELLEAIAEAQYAGEVRTRSQALEYARARSGG